MPMTAPQDGQAQLQQLMQMLQQKNSASANLAGLDDRYAQAQALRDAPNRGAQTGGVMGGLADILRGNTASKRMRELGPQRQASRQEIAGVQDATQIYKFQREMDKEKADAELKKELQVLKQTGKTADRAAKLADKKAYAVWKDKEGYGKASQAPTFKEWLRKRNKAQADQKEIIEFSNEKKLGQIAAENEAKNLQLPPLTAKQKTEAEAFSRESEGLEDIFSDFESRFGGSGLGYEDMRNRLIRNVPAVAKAIGVGKDAFDSEAWFARLQNYYTMPERHAIAGATLTPTEITEWNKALTPTSKQTPAQVWERIRIIRKYDTRVRAAMRKAYSPGESRKAWADRLFSPRGEAPQESAPPPAVDPNMSEEQMDRIIAEDAAGVL